jgi:hypothetical protein
VTLTAGTIAAITLAMINAVIVIIIPIQSAHVSCVSGPEGRTTAYSDIGPTPHVALIKRHNT